MRPTGEQRVPWINTVPRLDKLRGYPVNLAYRNCSNCHRLRRNLGRTMTNAFIPERVGHLTSLWKDRTGFKPKRFGTSKDDIIPYWMMPDGSVDWTSYLLQIINQHYVGLFCVRAKGLFIYHAMKFHSSWRVWSAASRITHMRRSRHFGFRRTQRVW